MNCYKRFASGASLKRSKYAQPLALFGVALLLSACASRPVSQLPELSDWQIRQQVLGELRDWEFSGRIAVSAGDDGFNGKLRWAQKDDAFQATVSGPLGIGTVRIEGEGSSAVLTDKDGVRTELQDVEQELLFRYGWTIPVKSLRYWALGIPDPTTDAQSILNENNQLARLEQGGWTLNISSYALYGGQSMPNRLSVAKNETRVRIVIDKWKFFD